MSISQQTYYARIRRGWSEEKAMSEPVRKLHAHERGTKNCNRCKQEKSIDHFYRLGRRNGKEYSAFCRHCSAIFSRERDQKLRLETLTHYSRGNVQCVRCNETRVDCLDLDHIKNNGSTDRKLSKSSYNLFRRLRKLGYPKGYQILCRNCNWIKHLKNLRKQGGKYGIL
jgi:hypothetical protein